MSEITEAWDSLALASVVETLISSVIAINSNGELAQKSPEGDTRNYFDSNNKVVALPLATTASVPLLSAPDATKDSDEEVAGDLEKLGESTITTKALENKKKREKKKRAAAERKKEVKGVHFSILEALAKKYSNLTTDQLKHGEDFPRSNQRKPVAADFKWKGPVIEATKDMKCSYIDLIANDKTPQGKSAVGYAKCFISHVYGYLFRMVVESIRVYEEKHPDTYYYFDLLCINQHAEKGAVISKDVLLKNFQEGIKS